MKNNMIQMMMVLGLGGLVMFSSQSQALSLNLSFGNGGISIRLDDDKHPLIKKGKLDRKDNKKLDRKDDKKLDRKDDKKNNNRR